MRERIFAEMTDEWQDAYEAGIFTEFMEQRAPGHTVLDDKIYRKACSTSSHDIEPASPRLDWLGRRRRPAASARAAARRCASPPRRVDPLRRAPRGAGARAGAAASRPAARRASWSASPRSAPRARARAARLPGSAAVLLVRPPGRHHRAQHLGRLLPRPPRPAPVAVLPARTWPTAR